MASKWPALLAAALLGLSSFAIPATSRANPTVCNTPTSKGAIVDSPARCEFFVHYDADDKKPDPRVVKNLQLGPDDRARSIAVIVGISKYKNPDFNIPAAHEDVVKLKSFLIDEQQFDEVIAIEDDKATIENIRYFLRKYAIDRTNIFKGKVRFLFAYSGHGVQVPFLGDGKQEFSSHPSVGLALSSLTRDDDYSNIYGLNELRPLFNDLAKNTFHFLALINACFGGDVFGDALAGGSSEPKDRGAYAITAGSDDKTVYSALNGQGSLFFQFLIDGVRSGDADHEGYDATVGKANAVADYQGIVRLGPLDDYLFGAIKRYIASHANLASDLQGNDHHWFGSVEPFGVRALGGFFFFLKVPQSVFTQSQITIPTGFFVPSKVQVDVGATTLSVDRIKGDGFDSLRSKDGTPVRGVDVAHFLGPIDWARVATQDIHFAYIKATQSTETVDSTFQSNWSATREAKIAHGAYHYYSFCAPPEAQFANLSHVVPQEPTMLPIAIDAELFPAQDNPNFGGPPMLAKESACAKSLGPSGVRDSLRRFADLIEQKYGMRPIIYGNDYLLDQVLTTEFTSQFPLWRAKLGLGSNPPRPPWTIWQYSQNAKIEGIRYGVDINVISSGHAANPSNLQ